MIKNVIFDIGNVLLRYQPKIYLDEKYHDEAITNRMMEELFTSDLWLCLDKGTLTQEEVVDSLSKKYPNDALKFQAVFEDWDLLLPRMEETWEFVKLLKQHHIKTYLLSNLHAKLWEHLCQTQADFINLFDGYVISSIEKMMKPDQRIYECILNRYQLKASETLFLDDTKGNVEASKICHIEGLVFNNVEEVKKECLARGYFDFV